MGLAKPPVDDQLHASQQPSVAVGTCLGYTTQPINTQTKPKSRQNLQQPNDIKWEAEDNRVWKSFTAYFIGGKLVPTGPPFYSLGKNNFPPILDLFLVGTPEPTHPKAHLNGQHSAGGKHVYRCVCTILKEETTTSGQFARGGKCLWDCNSVRLA